MSDAYERTTELTIALAAELQRLSIELELALNRAEKAREIFLSGDGRCLPQAAHSNPNASVAQPFPRGRWT